MKRHLSVISSVLALGSVARGYATREAGGLGGLRLHGRAHGASRPLAHSHRRLGEGEENGDEDGAGGENNANEGQDVNEDAGEDENNDADAAAEGYQYEDAAADQYAEEQQYGNEDAGAGADENNDQDAAADQDADQYEDYDESSFYEVEYGTTEDGLDGENVTSAMETIKSTLDATLRPFYETPPSEWTTSQWDLVFAALFGTLMACCIGAAGCAWCCIHAADPEGDELTEPLSPGREEGWTPRRPGKGTPPLSPFARAFKRRGRRAGNGRGSGFDEGRL